MATFEKPDRASPAELRQMADQLDGLLPDDLAPLRMIAERLWVLDIPWYRRKFRNAEPVAHMFKFIERVKNGGLTQRRLARVAAALREHANIVASEGISATAGQTPTGGLRR